MFHLFETISCIRGMTSFPFLLFHDPTGTQIPVLSLKTDPRLYEKRTFTSLFPQFVFFETSNLAVAILILLINVVNFHL